MEVSNHQPNADEPLIVDHGDGQPAAVVEDEPVDAAPAQDDDAAQTEPTEPDADGESEQLARSRGWVEEEKYHGKGKWVDAGSYNQRYEQIMPVVTRENRRMREEIKAFSEREAARDREIADLRKYQQEQAEAGRTIAYQTLMSQRSQAQAEGNFELADKLGDQLLDLKLEQKIALPRKPQQPQVDPTVKRILDEFAEDNPVFKDTRMQVYLAQQAESLARAGTDLRGRELLDEAKDQVMRIYPDRFKPVRRGPPMAEMNGAPARSNGNVRTWADLKPDEAKKQEEFLTGAFPKLDAKALNGMKSKLLKELPATAFRR